MRRANVKGVIIVAGSLAQRPGQGGHTWVFLQYLLGFRRLGWDVLFLDRLEPEMCVDKLGQRCSVDQSFNLAYFLDIMRRFGLSEAFSLDYNRGERVFGLSRERVLERARDSAFLLNVMGFLDDEQVLGCAARRVFLDIDPGFPQMWCELGWHDLFRGHDSFVTVGENIGQSECVIPTCGVEWIPSPQPVVLDYWPVSAAKGDEFTSIATWRGDNAPVEYNGVTYGLRAHEFRQFAALPRLSSQRFRLALDIHPAEVNDLSLLDTHGWSRVNTREAAGDPWAYQAFIQQSAAELMVAKQMYVRAKSGWFSDRSICYLASGRPVLAQETGFSRNYPTGHGLLAFKTLEDALSGADELARDPSSHARAAREVAEECFQSDKVLSGLLTKLRID